MKHAVILAGRLSANDARIEKVRQVLENEGIKTDLAAWVDKDGAYPTLPGATLLDWHQHAKLRETLGNLIALSRGNISAGTDLARAAAQRRVMIDYLCRRTDVFAGYDLVIPTDPETLVAATEAKKQGGFKLFYDAHEYYPDEVANDLPRKAWVLKAHEKAAPSLDAFITVNPEIAALYSKTHPRFPKATLIHNATKAAPKPIDDGRLRRAAGLADNKRILLFQGGFSKDRGLEHLIAAITLATEDWHLVLMGSGVLEDQLRAQAAALSAADRVTFLPPAPWHELHQWTAGASVGAILYVPSCLNQLLCSPNKLWEYPAAGVPVIASDLPFLGKMVKDHDLGLCVQPRSDAHTIATALSWITPDSNARLKRSCRLFSLEHTWETEAARLINLVRGNEVTPLKTPVSSGQFL